MLRRDLFTLASDAMRGREAGTIDEMRASAWIAMRAREAGLLPAGDDGTYFQFWAMRRVRPSMASTVELGGRSLAFGKEVVTLGPIDAALTAPIVFIGDADATELDEDEIRGNAVVALLQPPSRVPPAGVSLRDFRYTLAALNEQAAALKRLGPAAIVLVSDSVAEGQLDGFLGHALLKGRASIDSARTARPDTGAPVLWVTRRALDHLGASEHPALTVRLAAEQFVVPSVNVVATVPGTGGARAGEYVLFSAHQDHDGVGAPVDGDSIWNGADDNATASVALLAIGRAFAAQPAPRSALFVWHGAEERGLLGSRWFVWHPTVPRETIVAVLNADMLGRNHPDSAALLGVLPPHRNSATLVQLAMTANQEGTRFSVDTTWDLPSHPERWYFRSDHVPYARAGIPALFFTTLLHPEYHTPHDEPETIDMAKLARMARWMYATGWAVATARERPAIDPDRQPTMP